MEAMVKRCEKKPQKNTVCTKVGDRALNDLQQVDTGNSTSFTGKSSINRRYPLRL